MATQHARSEEISNSPTTLKMTPKPTLTTTEYLVPASINIQKITHAGHLGLQSPLNSCCRDDHTHRSSQTLNDTNRDEGKRGFGNNTHHLILQYQMPSKTLQSISISLASKFLNPKLIWENKPSPPIHKGKAQTCQLGLINTYI